MRKYVLFTLLCMMPATVFSLRRQWIEKLRLKTRPARPVKKREVSKPRVKEPRVKIVNPVPRLLHIADGDRDQRELASVVKDFKFQCFSCSALDRDRLGTSDILVVSNMSELANIVRRADSFKKIIVWVRRQCSEEEYELIRELARQEHVRMVVHSPYEKRYMQHRGISVDRTVVLWQKPASVVDRSVLYLAAGLLDVQINRVAGACRAHGIQILSEQYRGAEYLASAQEGALCFPGVMPDEFLEDCVQQGVVPFVPTIRFLKRLRFVPRNAGGSIHTSAWYSPEAADFVQYFNSWDDLKTKVREVDYGTLAQKMAQLGMEDQKKTCWKELLKEIAE